MTEHTPTTEQVLSSFPLSDNDRVTHPALAWDRIITVESLNRWLTAHDAETRTATLEEAAELLRHEAHRVAQLKILKPDYRQALVDTFYEASRVVTRAAKDGAQ